MMSPIRTRIALSVLALVAVLEVALGIFVLIRVHHYQRAAIDQQLIDLVERVRELSDHEADLLAYVDQTSTFSSKWTEVFIEVRDPTGRHVAATANVPPEGLEIRWRALGREGLPDGSTVEISETVRPASRKGHVHLRVAELVSAGKRIRVAHTLKAQQKAWWRLREQLIWGFVVISALAAAGAWYVARRALQPVGAIVDEAQRLGAEVEGTLPTSGRGDELDRLAEVLNDLLTRLRAELARVRRLGAEAAHALRTPLATIRGNLELRLSGPEPDEDPSLIHAIEALDDAIALVNRLLLLERLESTRLDPVSLETIDLADLVEGIAQALALVAADRDIELICETRSAQVRASEADLRQALWNLLDNALRHTPDGGRVEVRVDLAGTMARVTVRDGGKGIEPEQMERIFERFYSQRERGGGGGLGLPIARAVARRYGGDLTASSPGGAQFQMFLPTVRPEVD